MTDNQSPQKNIGGFPSNNKPDEVETENQTSKPEINQKTERSTRPEEAGGR